MKVVVLDYREGTCIWCDRRTEGVECDFGTLKGFLCKTDFLKKLRTHAENEKSGDAKTPVNETK